MQRIVPNLWFDHTAAEAAEFYASVFPDARVTDTQHYPSEGLEDFQAEMAGQVLMVEFELGSFPAPAGPAPGSAVRPGDARYRFIGINAGPEFQVNPSVSFMLNFDPLFDPQAREHLDELWTALSEGGQVLMPLGEYPFSQRYGWVSDRYGVSWQFILTNPEGEPRPFIIPSLMFGNRAQNRAKEAIDFYTSVFGGRVGDLAPYPEQTGPATAGSLMFGEFELSGQWFAAMDSGVEQDFTFDPGVSLMLECADQAELDRYWEQLSVDPEAEVCGWCVDKFGLSWQVVPVNLGELMTRPNAYAKLMGMGKIEIAAF